MIGELKYKLKNDKWLLVITIVCSLCFLVALATAIFDIVQIVVVKKSAVLLSGAFLVMNIVSGALNILCIIAVIIFTVLKRG